MSSKRILMNDDLDYEEREAAVLIIDINKENKDDDGFDFKVQLMNSEKRSMIYLLVIM